MKKFIALFLTIIVMLGAVALVGCSDTGFTVTFDGNGGTQVAGDTASLVQTVESANELVEPKFERAGYNFIGWNVDLIGIVSDTKVKAQWQEIGAEKKTTFTVTFDGNGGAQVAGDTASLVQTVESASQLVAPRFERAGYVFAGWNVLLSTIKGDTVVVAQWTNEEQDNQEIEIRLANQYYHSSKNKTITYTISGDDVFTIDKGNLITSLNIATPTIEQRYKDDFVFEYWAYKDGAGEYIDIASVRATDDIAENGIIVLYPVSRYMWIGPY